MNTLKEILGWIFGIIFVIGGLGTFAIGFFPAIILIFIGILLLPISSNYINNYVKIIGWKKFFLILILFYIYSSIIGNYNFIDEDNYKNKTEEKNIEKKGDEKIIKEEKINIGKYEIINSKDLSHKVLLNKSLSLHTPKELENLVLDKKMLYRVVFDGNIKNNQINPTINKIILDLSNKDKDIDELSLFIYSDKDLVEGPYDIGSATWAPNGKLGNITPEIAKNNLRNNYKISYKINIKDIEKYFKQRNKKEIKFNLSKEERRQYFKESVKIEDEAFKKYPLDYIKTAAGGNILIKLQDTYINKKKNELMKKYKINKKENAEIISEAFKENWPLD